MRRLLALLLVLLAPGLAGAAEWQYEDGGTPIAYFDNGAAQLQFACRGGDLTMGFWVRQPHAQVARAGTMSVAITPDPPKGAAGTPGGGSSFAQDMPLIHADGSSVIVRGPVARQWAAIARRARAGIAVAYVHKDAQGALAVFNGQDFGAGGSSAAIKRVLDRCG